MVQTLESVESFAINLIFKENYFKYAVFFVFNTIYHNVTRQLNSQPICVQN